MERLKNREDGIICRAARLTDYDSVMDIGDVYWGLDYLPHYYNKYINDPDYYCFVCEVDEQIVGFIFFYLINGGKDVVTGGTRVHPDYRNLGITQKLMDIATKVVEAAHPGATHNYLYTTFDTERNTKFLQEDPNLRKALTRGRLISLVVDMGVIMSFLKTKRAREIPHLDKIHFGTKEDFIAQMEHLPDSLRTSLFPENLLDVFWMPYKLMTSNYKQICNTGPVFWTKREKQPLSDTCSIGPMISFIRAYPCKAGLKVGHYNYGADGQYLKSHVYAVFKYIEEQWKSYSGPVEYILYYPFEGRVSDADIFADDIQWLPGKFAMYDKRVACVNIPPSNL